MPQTDAESTNGAYGFKFDEEPAAIVHLLRASDPVDFKKMCPDLEQHGRSTGAGAMFSSMFRALHGAIKKTGELPDRPKAKDFCAAYKLCPKVGRPRREVAARDQGDKIAAAAEEERRTKHVNARQKQRRITTPAGLDSKCHVGGFTTRGNKVEPVKDAAILSVCLPFVSRACWKCSDSSE